MQLYDIKNLFEYNDWANDILVDMLVAAFGEDADLRTAAEPMVKQIQETAVHILGALDVWQRRWLGGSPSKMLDEDIFPTPQELRMAFHQVRSNLWMYFDSAVTEDMLSEVIAYRNTRGKKYSQPLGAMMQHVVNHCSYHRGQITARLMALGYDEIIQSTDFSTWTVLKMRK